MIAVRTSVGRLRLLLVLCGLIPAFASRADAQRRISADGFKPPYDSDGLAGIQGTVTPGPLRWNAMSWTSWVRRPLRSQDRVVLKQRLIQDLALQLGIGGRIALGVGLPFVPFQEVSFEMLGDGFDGVSSTGVGDPRGSVRYRFLGAPSSGRVEIRRGLGLAVQGTVTLPLGQEAAFVSEKGSTAEVALLGDMHFVLAAVAARVGLRHRFRPVTVDDVRFRDELDLGVGVDVVMPFARSLSLLLETRTTTDAGRPFADSGATSVELQAGARIRFPYAIATLAAGPGFGGGVVSPDYRVALGISFALPEHDADLDGVPDATDHCPHLEEDHDGVEDGDGCPDFDDEDF